MTHWAESCIGQAWVPGDNDCWSFARRIWGERFGIEVPAVSVDTRDLLAIAHAFRDHDERLQWLEVAEPKEGDAVLMAHFKHPSHVGLWVEVDGGGVLHCQHPSGVVFASRAALSRAGWGRVEFYRHRSRL